MEMKRMFVQVVNLNEGKVFSLPTLYTDRVEACVCGQNYIRDRQAEDYSVNLFFRVLISKDGTIPPAYSLWDDEDEDEDEEENDFNWDDPSCQSSRKSCDKEPSQPVNKEIIIGGKVVAELIDLLRSKAPEAPEEPNYETYGWND